MIYQVILINLQKIEDKLNIIQRAKEKRKENQQKDINELINDYEQKIKNIIEKGKTLN